MEKKKVYFVLKSQDGDYFWENINGDRLRFAGNPKLLFKSMAQLYGKEMTENFFKMFMESCINIENHREGGATFVLYKYKKNDLQKQRGESEETLSTSEERLV